MKRALWVTLVMLAVVALASSRPRAQSGTDQKPQDAKPAAAAATAPTDTQKTAEPTAELPADAKAFNAAAGEKNPSKRIEALEKFVADNSKSSSLVGTARSLITSSVLLSFKESRAKFMAQAETDIAEAKKRTDTTPIYSTYNNLASRLVNAGIYSEEAEDFARKGLSAMDEATYKEMRKKQYERALAAYEKATAPGGAAKPTPPAAPAAAATPAAPNYRFVTKDGVTQVTIAPPAPPRAPAAPRPPTKPTMPTDDEIRTNLQSLRASALSTLGQVLMKRGKTEEGEKVLVEAYRAKPASSAMATIARLLSESAKKAGNEKSQTEYMTVLALSGRITADETREFEALYRKANNGSLDGMDKMLDDRWHRENVRFAVSPFERKAGTKPLGRTVLAEMFPGAG